MNSDVIADGIANFLIFGGLGALILTVIGYLFMACVWFPFVVAPRIKRTVEEQCARFEQASVKS